MNSVNLVGRIVKDLELRKTQTGESFLYFTVAVNRTFTNKNGEREADFINCVAWRKQAENMVQYLSKGSLVSVTGRITTRNYEQNGQRVFITEVIADSVQFLESKNVNRGTNTNQPSQNNSNSFTDFSDNNNQSNNDFFADFSNNSNTQPTNNNDVLSTLDISDDELPF